MRRAGIQKRQRLCGASEFAKGIRLDGDRGGAAVVERQGKLGLDERAFRIAGVRKRLRIGTTSLRVGRVVGKDGAVDLGGEPDLTTESQFGGHGGGRFGFAGLEGMQRRIDQQSTTFFDGAAFQVCPTCGEAQGRGSGGGRHERQRVVRVASIRQRNRCLRQPGVRRAKLQRLLSSSDGGHRVAFGRSHCGQAIRQGRQFRASAFPRALQVFPKEAVF
jgi:hypothetical protein